jgi:glycosyltransferase involved in cell wall biosynthesis
VDSHGRETMNIYYHGSLEEHFGVDTLVRAMPQIKALVPNARLHIYGAGRLEEELRRSARETGMDNYVTFHGMVPFYQLPEILKNADLGVVPTKGSTFSEEALSMKSLEYMAMGIPIVISQTKVHNMYYDPSMVLFFEPGDADDLAARVARLCADKAERDFLARNALKFIAKYGWCESKKSYLEIIDRLTLKKG